MRARNRHEKEYQVEVNKEITPEFLKKMASGVPILDTVTRPCRIQKTGERSFTIILTQGLNRQIRRKMCIRDRCNTAPARYLLPGHCPRQRRQPYYRYSLYYWYRLPLPAHLSAQPLHPARWRYRYWKHLHWNPSRNPKRPDVYKRQVSKQADGYCGSTRNSAENII